MYSAIDLLDTNVPAARQEKSNDKKGLEEEISSSSSSNDDYNSIQVFKNFRNVSCKKLVVLVVCSSFQSLQCSMKTTMFEPIIQFLPISLSSQHMLHNEFVSNVCKSNTRSLHHFLIEVFSLSSHLVLLFTTTILAVFVGNGNENITYCLLLIESIVV